MSQIIQVAYPEFIKYKLRGKFSDLGLPRGRQKLFNQRFLFFVENVEIWTSTPNLEL